MRVRTLIRFSDLKENKIREVGNEFEATNARLNEINSASKSALVEVIEKEKTPKGGEGDVGGNKAKPKNQKRKS